MLLSLIPGITRDLGLFSVYSELIKPGIRERASEHCYRLVMCTRTCQTEIVNGTHPVWSPCTLHHARASTLPKENILTHAMLFVSQKTSMIHWKRMKTCEVIHLKSHYIKSIYIMTFNYYNCKRLLLLANYLCRNFFIARRFVPLWQLLSLPSCLTHRLATNSRV